MEKIPNSSQNSLRGTPLRQKNTGHFSAGVVYLYLRACQNFDTFRQFFDVRIFFSLPRQKPDNILQVAISRTDLNPD